ncbi:unnamed protein product [Notodromas monacha]|uniref:Uncharacterized protein n=1 Tax=Notodromas monacha TaxID=399045 RepID=A0A7R9BLA6_9CRUS|nr:unnamed protein product [Notodromas monacha]CAG0916735.1 unnamed protein product [Notodromas monacha]
MKVQAPITLCRTLRSRLTAIFLGGGHDTSVLPPAPYNVKALETRHSVSLASSTKTKWCVGGTKDEEDIDGIPSSNIIYYPNYNSSGKVIPDDDSVKREVAIAQLASDAKKTPLPIQCTPGVSIGTEVTAFDWVKSGQGDNNLIRAQYLRVQCPSALFSKDSTNCFQLSNRSAFDVNDTGLKLAFTPASGSNQHYLGSPVVLNYGQANATAVAIKAYTFNVTATETMMAAASFSDPEVWSFVCQYAEKCIGNFTTTTSVPSTSTPLIPTTTPTGAMKTPPGPDSQPPPPPGKWAKQTPTFPPQKWNIHQAVLNDLGATNNFSEAWNRYSNGLVGKKNPTIWLLIRCQKQDAASVPTTLKKFDEDGVIPHKQV